MNKSLAIYSIDTGIIESVCSYPEEDISSLRNNLQLQNKDFVFCNRDTSPNSYFNGTDIVLLPPKPSSYHKLNHNTKQWEDSRSLEDLKDYKWNIIKKLRDQEEFSYFEFNGLLYDCSAKAQQRIISAAYLASSNTSIELEWTLADNTIVMLSSIDLINLQVALSNHIIDIHTKARNIRYQIYSCNTAEELDYISW